jgi:hypothetical protein
MDAEIEEDRLLAAKVEAITRAIDAAPVTRTEDWDVVDEAGGPAFESDNEESGYTEDTEMEV